MSITQEQYDAIKPGDRVELVGGWIGTVVGVVDGWVWVASLAQNMAYPFKRERIVAIIPPAPQAVAWVNLDANGRAWLYSDRLQADSSAHHARTHVITIYSDSTTTSIETKS